MSTGEINPYMSFLAFFLFGFTLLFLLFRALPIQLMWQTDEVITDYLTIS